MADTSNRKAGTRPNVRRVGAIFLLAAVMFLLFQSKALVSWSYDLPSNFFTENLVGLLEQWDVLVENLGFVAVTEQISEWMELLREGQF